MKFSVRSHSCGFSLIEVLVAVVILSVGLLALASLQVNLIRASSDAKAQTNAFALAKDTLETLRSYTDINGYVALAAPAVSNPVVGGVTYTVTPSVSRWVYNAGTSLYESVNVTATEAALTATVGKTYIVGRDFKKLSVAVAWNDAANNSRSVTLEDMIDGLDPTKSANVAKNASAISPRKVEVLIANPSGTLGVIPIAIDPSNSESTAATNPRPIIDQGGHETRFDVYTYSAISGNNAIAQARVETTLAGCTCDTATASNTDKAYRPTYWDGTHYIEPTLDTTPHAGHANLGNGNNAPKESPYCDICCRDHYDSPTLASGKPKFDPWRSTHEHYYYNNSNVLTVAGTTHTYMEACRMIRVNGIYRVAADLNNEYFNLLETRNDGTTSEYAPTTTGVTNYQNIALDYLDAKVVSNNAPNSYNNKVSAGTLTTLESNRNINNPTSITIQRTADHKYLHSRGLYIDHLESEALDAIAAAKTLCVTNSCTTAEKSVAVLSLMPFTSINLTELSTWAPVASSIVVTDGSFFSSTGGTPIRGYVTPGSMNNASAFTIDATSDQMPSNSGLLSTFNAAVGNGLAPIDNDEQTDIATASKINHDAQTFAIPASAVVSSAGFFTIAFTGYNGFSESTPIYPQFSGTNITTCTHATTGNGNNAVTNYTCGVSTLPTAPLALTAVNYNYSVAASTGYTLDNSTSNGASSDNFTKGCTGPSGTLYNYTTGGSDTKLVACKNYTLSTAASNLSGATASPASPTNDTLLTESTVTTVSNVTSTSPYNIITLNFSGPTIGLAGYSCTYTSTQSGKPKNPVITSLKANCP